MLLVLGSCLHSRKSLVPNTWAKEGSTPLCRGFFNCFKGHKLTKHPFSQRHAGQDSLKRKRKWSLFYTHPALALWGTGAAALQ